ncbi:hypothetical protein Ahy_A03g014655 isoform A [Arachis hypogaea]|uniref:Uncharacterized protein n=1 Tax=Arachis hypogaea TaxID=3818 RepID=A0A445DYB6_ARAHY|nr:hypothetical protein Ahy_A03g014655 isoform A [Arachis hypogaea]
MNFRLYSDAVLARVTTEKRMSMIKAREESEKSRAENKRRESTYVEDLFIVHIVGMDTMACGFKNAAKLIEFPIFRKSCRMRRKVVVTDSAMVQLAMAKDPKRTFFKRLEGLQPCEVSELKAGTHIFAVYGDNFFKTASYTIKAVCAKSYEDTTQKLKNIEAQIALARYQEVTERYAKEKQFVL